MALVLFLNECSYHNILGKFVPLGFSLCLKSGPMYVSFYTNTLPNYRYFYAWVCAPLLAFCPSRWQALFKALLMIMNLCLWINLICTKLWHESFLFTKKYQPHNTRPHKLPPLINRIDTEWRLLFILTNPRRLSSFLSNTLCQYWTLLV